MLTLGNTRLPSGNMPGGPVAFVGPTRAEAIDTGARQPVDSPVEELWSGFQMDKPKLRPIQAVPVRDGERVLVQLYDPTRLSDQVAVVPQEMLYLLSMFDGTHSIVDIQAALTRRSGRLVFSHEIERVVEQLDEALFLDSERFAAHVRGLTEAFRQAPVRAPCSAGAGYEAEPEELRRQLDGLFTLDGGPGKPKPGSGDGSLVGLVAPHIDLERGGPCYAHAYKALAEECDAELFVVLGTAHFAAESLYILTRKSFETPLGTLRTDQALVDAVDERVDGDLFAEELVHRNEHSIEFQAIFLQHLLDGRDIEMLPILCCSMGGAVAEEQSPREVEAIGSFLDALRDVVAESGKRACVIAGADLAHVGHHFGDEYALTPSVMADVERADRDALEHAVALDADGFYEAVELDGNARHICGLPPIYALLATTTASRCELLDYRQAVDYDVQRAVTFASLALYA